MRKTGLGTRVTNFIVDTLIVFGITYGINRWWDFYVMYWQYPFIPLYDFFFGLIFIYYTVFEGIFKRTPGKWLSISKVVNKHGGRPAFWQIIVRSLIRLTIIDCFFIPFIDKPLHDYLSKTEVVEA
jgi:uncharacterized RDD family membrane protein YckC